MLKYYFLRFFTLASAIFLLANANALEDLSAHWDGIWVVEGTLFSIAVAIENEEFRVRQVESLGFEWTSKNGKIDGNIVTVEIEYAGVAGTIQAELVDPNTAVAFAATCLPEFMVVCMLSKDRQAVFRKVTENADN
ncbi:MAG: hypothetical protein COB20_16140 [SAR86 cluster bacterium]|uniref:Uncharacterized protein n=1 Tax=SAR86 cluster bacterium TaxID=2030880 RepID=A0A2A4WUN4_9GAMM|nr:MAG: hypothetical protein COB20_16140 [SAR86 cluster bacterium]